MVRWIGLLGETLCEPFDSKCTLEIQVVEKRKKSEQMTNFSTFAAKLPSGFSEYMYVYHAYLNYCANVSKERRGVNSLSFWSCGQIFPVCSRSLYSGELLDVRLLEVLFPRSLTLVVSR